MGNLAEALDRASTTTIDQLLAPKGTQPRVAMLRQLPEARRKRLIAGLPTATALASTLLLGYAEDALGAWADPDVVALLADTRAGDALERLRLAPATQPLVLLADAGRRLAGVVGLGALLQAPEGATRQAHPISALPVVNISGRFIGLIRQAERMEAVEEEASLDIQTMVGASPDERALSTPGFAVRKRLPWLQIDLLTAFLAVAMRGLVLREISLRHWRSVVGKEALVGLMNGLAVAATAGLAGTDGDVTTAPAG